MPDRSPEADRSARGPRRRGRHGWGTVDGVRSRGTTWDDHERTRVGPWLVHAALAGPPGRPTVVLVHGQGCSHRYWAPLAAPLSRVARVVAVDLPGFGDTPAGRTVLDLRGLSQVLADWLRATGRERVLVVGHSVGTQVVVDVAAHSPDLLDRVVLVGPTVDDRARSWGAQAVRLVSDLVLERPTLLPVLVGDYLRCGPVRFVRTFSSMLAGTAEDTAPLLTGPTLVLRGRWDPVAPRGWSRRLAARLPEGRVVEVPACGHNVNWTRPGRLAEVLAGELDAAAASVRE